MYCHLTLRLSSTHLKTRMRYLDDVEADLRQLEVRRWRAVAADRPACLVICEETLGKQ
ncbi:unnamed protein product [Nezara viridula]|uniref:Uncharacterized protein n=1 Tax=Nezara viridula TaxID=85310 RepID=A0A9P0H5X4_NEZVI|nr:unnamed protein product [Nezara viridula]